MDMTKCSKCGLPETYETIEFGSDGGCNVCTQFEFKQQTLIGLKEKAFGQFDEDTVENMSMTALFHFLAVKIQLTLYY